MALKGKLVNFYERKDSVTGRPSKRWVWEVTGSPSEVERYATEQGENVRKDEVTGKFLFFTTKFPGVRETEIKRVVLADGTVLYNLNMMEKNLQIEIAKIDKIAQLEAELEVFGIPPAGQPQRARISTQPAPAIANAVETEEVVEGQENLGEAM